MEATEIEYVEPYPNRQAGFNLAGIVPIAGYQNEYGTVWPDYLNPIAPGYYPVQKSIMECAFAGCDTIWVICNNDYAPMVKKYIGESVFDPATYERQYTTKGGHKKRKYKSIPIMYVSMPNKYLLNCTIPFSILYGAFMVKRTTNRVSKWIRPNRYFVSFMNQQYDIGSLYDIRKHIKNYNPFFVSHNTKTIIDDVSSAFTFDHADLYDILKWSKVKNNTSAKDVFSKIKTENSYIWEPKYAFDTKTWQGLREYMGSPLTENHKLLDSLFTGPKFKPLS